ncbi:ABC transporter ATP-binding protein [Flavimaricola marinus]|uniref:Putative multidrug export ATP-binding/permease protein n=1 Tax=Flavimaricola marinus TaxID=1819565 RepID=A0A238LBQ9_9RHOB|nr:ABC transporter ATP-binding protein [Flavimaricola marinus]SMY07167.1 Putative multidrug export ATP-binding/permease protein [Flavimaricola marinus]
MRTTELIDPFQPAEGPPPRTLWRFFAWCLSGAGWFLAASGLIAALAGMTEVLAALALGWVIDATDLSAPEVFWSEQIWLVLGCAILFLAIRPIALSGSSAMNTIVLQPNLAPLVLSKLHRWTMGHSISFFDSDFAGRIAQKQMQVSSAVTEVTSEFVNTLCFALASLIGSTILLLSIDWRVALGFGLWVLAYLYLITWFLPRIRKRAKARANARANLSGQVVDTITNMKTVKLFAHAEHEDQAALGAMEIFRLKAADMGVLNAWFRLALMTLAGLIPVMMLGGTLILWRQGQATAGDIAAAGAIALRIGQMTGWVSFTLMSIYSNLGEVEDGMVTLTPPHGLVDDPNAKPLDVTNGEVVFDNVTFAYGQKIGGIKDINLRIAPGERLGIVGASGAGKSTLVSTLLRLHDTETGSISIDGQDLRGVTQESLRRQIGMVTQETAMFNRTARDNILYGRPEATEEELINAAKRAEAHGFIKSLTDFGKRVGYDAYLGERGVKLSGGQRQRIALARALLKDAPILVLDEATSALDSEVEASIQTALEAAMEGKTVIAIAHRLSTIASMDRIVVLDAGRIVEEGSHDELLAQGGLYARYWNRQSGGFLSTDDDLESQSAAE